MEAKQYSDLGIAFRLWFLTFINLSIGAFLFALINEQASESFFILFAFVFASSIGSSPTIVVYAFTLYRIEWLNIHWTAKLKRVFILNFIITLLYGLATGYISTSFSYDNNPWVNFITETSISTGILFACSCVAILMSYKRIKYFFSFNNIQTNNINSSNQINTYMERNDQQISTTHSNKIFIKGIITAALILLMLIPMIFIQNLVTEREERQKEVVKEVSSKWATAQTVTAPYLVIPYKDTNTQMLKNIIVLPASLSLKGSIIPEERPRSIYKVLLYRSDINMQGNFFFEMPKNVGSLNLADAKICVGISDFKGIEEKIKINYNNASLDLTPGFT